MRILSPLREGGSKERATFCSLHQTPNRVLSAHPKGQRGSTQRTCPMLSPGCLQEALGGHP